jgi:glucosamine-6-phosphate isomerase
LGAYRYLVSFYVEGSLSFRHVVTFNMDEYVDLPREHRESYHSFMWTNLFKHVDIVPSNVHLLDGNAVDLKRECEAYEEKIRAVGGVELFLGGIGTDGHIAFNEPGSSLQSRTRVKTLAYETIVANARFFDHNLDLVPKMALTVGVATIMDAREVLLIISGLAKAAALEKCVEQGVNHMFTLSAIQMHPCACIVCDDDATAELRVRTVRYFKGLEKGHTTRARTHAHTHAHTHTHTHTHSSRTSLSPPYRSVLRSLPFLPSSPVLHCVSAYGAVG